VCHAKTHGKFILRAKKYEPEQVTDPNTRGQGAIAALVVLNSSNPQHNCPIQNIYERATRAELAKDFDTAFRLYVEAGSAFLNLSRAAAYPHTQKQALQDANRALGRAERIQAAVKRDLAPVWRDPFALGSSSRRAFFLSDDG
jgi:hypothetical protein